MRLKKNTSVVKSDPFTDETSIGNLLIQMKALTKEQLLLAIGRKAHHDEMLLGGLLKELGFVDDTQVAAALTLQAKLRRGDKVDAALTMTEMRLDAFSRNEQAISEEIGRRRQQQTETPERGLWVVPFSPVKA